MSKIIIVTGLSGAGKTQALKSLADIDYDVIDNVPVHLLQNLFTEETVSNSPVAIGLGVRSKGFITSNMLEIINQLKEKTGLNVEIVFLDCSDDVLLRRFSETRLKHPLANDRLIIDGITHERSILGDLRDHADIIIDTTDLSPNDLKRHITQIFGEPKQHELIISLISFSYKGGIPREADTVFDVRFLKNPHWEESLRPMNGTNIEVQNYIKKDRNFHLFVEKITDLIEFLIPAYHIEGKSYFTIAIGCTGGKHRSVFVAEFLADYFRKQNKNVVLRHRQLDLNKN